MQRYVEPSWPARRTIGGDSDANLITWNVDGRAWMHDLAFAPIANMYLKDDFVRRAYMRQLGDPYPPDPLFREGKVRMVGNGAPAYLFMWGQLEGVVSPHPTADTQEPPAAKPLNSKPRSSPGRPEIERVP